MLEAGQSLELGRVVPEYPRFDGDRDAATQLGRRRSANSLPDCTESRSRLRYQAEHKLLRTQQGLVIKCVP